MTALPVLIIYAYSSFAAPWGAGPYIIQEFQKTCRCEVKLVDAGDSGSLLSRLKIEGQRTLADVVVGIDQNDILKIKIDLGWNVPYEAFDYGPYAFVYNASVVSDPPKSLDDLLDLRWKGEVLIEDPRLSSAGLGFLLWVLKEKGEPGTWDFLEKFKTQLKTITPSWDLAYGLFKKNKAKLVFSYWMSPAYHIQEEHRHDIKAAAFQNGNYIQKEYFFPTPGLRNLALKKKFKDFLVGPVAQKLIPIKNFMYPINKNVPLPPAFNEIGTVKTLSPMVASPDQISRWLKKWREIFSR